jgi:hypothetical protein
MGDRLIRQGRIAGGSAPNSDAKPRKASVDLDVELLRLVSSSGVAPACVLS